MDTAVTGTAIGPMVIAAVDQFEEHPLVRDELAARILPASGRWAVAAARWKPVRRMLFSATEKKILGLWASMLCRKRYIDDRLDATSARTAVVLGAGFDTRGSGSWAGRVFEVDLPANVKAKEERLLAMFGALPDGLTLVPVDLENQDLAVALTERGYAGDEPVFFVWEAVTQYLTEDAVRATLAFFAGALSGSELTFTFLRKDFLEGDAMLGAEAGYREFVTKRRMWKFGLMPDDVPALLEPFGWRQVEQLGPEEFSERYVRPSGRA